MRIVDAHALAAVCAPLEPMGGLGKCRLVRFALRRLGVNGNYITEEWSRFALSIQLVYTGPRNTTQESSKFSILK